MERHGVTPGNSSMAQSRERSARLRLRGTPQRVGTADEPGTASATAPSRDQQAVTTAVATGRAEIMQRCMGCRDLYTTLQACAIDQCPLRLCRLCICTCSVCRGTSDQRVEMCIDHLIVHMVDCHPHEGPRDTNLQCRLEALHRINSRAGQISSGNAVLVPKSAMEIANAKVHATQHSQSSAGPTSKEIVHQSAEGQMLYQAHGLGDTGASVVRGLTVFLDTFFQNCGTCLAQLPVSAMARCDACNEWHCLVHIQLSRCTECRFRHESEGVEVVRTTLQALTAPPSFRSNSIPIPPRSFVHPTRRFQQNVIPCVSCLNDVAVHPNQADATQTICSICAVQMYMRHVTIQGVQSHEFAVTMQHRCVGCGLLTSIVPYLTCRRCMQRLCHRHFVSCSRGPSRCSNVFCPGCNAVHDCRGHA